MRTAERRSKENVKAMESRHNLEMSRIKQVLFDFLIYVIVMVVVAVRMKQILSICCRWCLLLLLMLLFVLCSEVYVGALLKIFRGCCRLANHLTV